MLGSTQCLYSPQGLDQKMLLLSTLAYSQKVILKNFHLVFPFYQSGVLLCDVSKIYYQENCSLGYCKYNEKSSKLMMK